MSPLKTKTILITVSEHLCTGCSTCQFACPHNAIRMIEIPSGFLLPQLDESKCTLCGICLKICPGKKIESGHDKNDSSVQKGKVIKAFIARSTDPAILLKSQSGGVATSLLHYLLKHNKVDSALVTTMSGGNYLRPEPILARQEDQILNSCGSKYCHVPLNAKLSASHPTENLAIVGLPCHIHGIYNLRSTNVALPKIKINIGLICDRVQSFHAIDYLIDIANVDRKKVIDFEYRSKRLRGWPGDVRIRTSEGQEKYVLSKKRQAIKDVFTPLRCRLCFDKFNIFSDIVLGDAWGLCKDKNGITMVFVRTSSGLGYLLDAEKEGYLVLNEISPEECFEKQSYDKFHKRWSHYMSAWSQMGKTTPDYGIPFQVRSSGIKLFYYKRQLKWAAYFSSLKSKEKIKKSLRKKLAYEKISSLPIVKNVLKRIGYSSRL